MWFCSFLPLRASSEKSFFLLIWAGSNEPIIPYLSHLFFTTIHTSFVKLNIFVSFYHIFYLTVALSATKEHAAKFFFGYDKIISL